MTHKRFLKFGIVGGVNTAIDFGVFSILLYMFSVPVLWAHVAGFLLAVLNSYVMNKYWTFDGTDGHDSRLFEFTLFMLTVVVGLGLSTLVIWALIPYIHPLLAKMATVIVSFGWNFTVSHYFVFRPD